MKTNEHQMTKHHTEKVGETWSRKRVPQLNTVKNDTITSDS